MLSEEKSGMQCAEFDGLLTEALDGTLRGERRECFDRHKAECATCGTLYEEAQHGLAWLSELEEVEPPHGLVHNILAATSGAAAQAAEVAPKVSAWRLVRQQVHAMFAPVLTPRFAMSMGMAFFSITLVLNMAQIRIKDLTPHNLSHTFYSSQNKVMKYYENMRLVYEIESRVRDLRNASEESEREREEQNRNQQKNHNQTHEQNQNSAPERIENPRGLEAQIPASPDRSELRMWSLALQRREL
jgi:hypothetical protein